MKEPLNCAARPGRALGADRFPLLCFEESCNPRGWECKMPMIADDVLHLVLKGLACHTQKLHTPGNRTLPTRIVLQLQYLSLFPCFKPVIQIAFGAKAR